MLFKKNAFWDRSEQTGRYRCVRMLDCYTFETHFRLKE